MPGVRAGQGSGQWSVVSGQDFESPNLIISKSQITNPQSLIPNPSAISPHPNPLPAGEGTISLHPSGPTFFEILTALALCHFARCGADVAVLEVGLGGRLDSTNVCTPLVSVITSISFDHTKQLGETLAAIAGEKAASSSPAYTSSAE